MKKTTGRRGQHTAESVMTLNESRKPTVHRRHIVEGVLWMVGVVILGIVGMVVHTHPAPWPFEVAFTKMIQGPHPIPCTSAWVHQSGVDIYADFINRLDDPIPTVVIPLFWMGVLALLRWFRRAFLLGVAVLSGIILWDGLTVLVDRPRPSATTGICVHRMINAFSFPSGHVIHDGILYGFLLYLSFLPLVRAWRYRWVVLPFQVLVVLYLLALGFSRLRAGEHWLIDVLGGYLTAVLWLFLFIFLDRWITNLLAAHHARHIAVRSA